MDLDRVFQKLDSHNGANAARPAKSPFFAEQAGLVTRIKPREHTEPTNEELGIVPVRGWRLAVVWLAPYLLLAIAFGGYYAIGKVAGWLP